MFPRRLNDHHVNNVVMLQGVLLFFLLYVYDFPPYSMQYAETAVVPWSSIIATEVERLKSVEADLVVLAYIYFFT